MSRLVSYSHVLLIPIIARHEVATRTHLMAGVNKFKSRDTWEGALACYTAAYRGHQLSATGKIVNGQQMSIENTHFH